MKIEIEDLKKVSLKESDVLVLKMKSKTRPDQIKEIRTNLQSVFPDNKVLIYSDAIELIIAQMHRDFDEVKCI